MLWSVQEVQGLNDLPMYYKSSRSFEELLKCLRKYCTFNKSQLTTRCCQRHLSTLCSRGTFADCLRFACAILINRFGTRVQVPKMKCPITLLGSLRMWRFPLAGFTLMPISSGFCWRFASPHSMFSRRCVWGFEDLVGDGCCFESQWHRLMQCRVTRGRFGRFYLRHRLEDLAVLDTLLANCARVEVCKNGWARLISVNIELKSCAWVTCKCIIHSYNYLFMSPRLLTTI